jgi:hypothetical protein
MPTVTIDAFLRVKCCEVRQSVPPDHRQKQTTDEFTEPAAERRMISETETNHWNACGHKFIPDHTLLQALVPSN